MSYYNEESRGYYGQNQPQSSSGPPQVPYPWVAEWDERDGRWIYINRDNGERTFQHPQPSYGGGGGYGERSYEQGYGGQGYGGQEQREYYEQQPEKKDHTVRNTVLGAAAGVLGGALLMHEGEKVGESTADHTVVHLADHLQRINSTMQSTLSRTTSAMAFKMSRTSLTMPLVGLEKRFRTLKTFRKMLNASGTTVCKTSKIFQMTFLAGQVERSAMSRDSAITWTIPTIKVATTRGTTTTIRLVRLDNSDDSMQLHALAVKLPAYMGLQLCQALHQRSFNTAYPLAKLS